jgi:hypothetical protein
LVPVISKWLGPEQLSISVAQIDDRHFGQPFQFGLDLWIGCPAIGIRASVHHDAAPDWVIR